MPIIGAGLSHKTAPVEIREKLAISEDKLPEALQQLLSKPVISEAVMLSTCNRTEVYAVVTDNDSGKEDIVTFFSSYHGIDRKIFDEALYFYSEEKIVHHLFRVAASLDSMVLGEAQILGQVKQAYLLAYENGATDIILNRLFRHAIECGKRVRSDTAIGEAPVSISYAAVQLAKTVFESLENRPVMVIGAGKISELTVKHLVSHGANPVFVTNRTFSRAKDLASKFSGVAVPYEDRFKKMVNADIVISSTGAPSYVIEKEEVQNLMKLRRYRPMFFIDIAVPRDIDPKAGDISNVFLYDIDDLKTVVDESLQERKKEAEKAEVIVRQEVGEFLEWLGSLEVVPTIKELRDYVEKVKELELKKVMRKLSKHSDKEEDLEVIKAFAVGVLNKLLHGPTVKLKEKANEKDGYLYVKTLRQLFELDDKEK